MSKLETLFKEKLAGHMEAPPAGAWQKVEARLSKKNKAVVWLRWAAVFILGALLFTTFLLTEQGPAERVAKDSRPTQLRNERDIQNATQDSLAVDTKEAKKIKNVSGAKKAHTKSAVQQLLKEPEVEQETAQLTIQPSDQVMQAEPVTVERKPIVLVYTLGPVDSAPPQTEATATDKKDSSIKKVMEFALNMKNSDPLSELRVIKEDLLALDLKKKAISKKQ